MDVDCVKHEAAAGALPQIDMCLRECETDRRNRITFNSRCSDSVSLESDVLLFWRARLSHSVVQQCNRSETTHHCVWLEPAAGWARTNSCPGESGRAVIG